MWASEKTAIAIPFGYCGEVCTRYSIGLSWACPVSSRCPFSLSRLIKITDKGQVVYKAEKQSCSAFPAHNGDGITSGPKRNFQVVPSLYFIAEFTQHIPPKGSHLIRYYGFLYQHWLR